MFYILDEDVDHDVAVFPVLRFRHSQDVGKLNLPETEILEPIELPKFKLEKGANLRDIISGDTLYSSFGIFINSKTRDVIDQLKIRKGHLFKLDLVDSQNESIENYFYLHLTKHNESIDFANSTFKVLSGLDEIDEMTLSSAEDYIQTFRRLILERKKIRPKKIKLSGAYEDYDLFSLNGCGVIEPVLSEKGKKLFEEAKITGVTIKPVDWIS